MLRRRKAELVACLQAGGEVPLVPVSRASPLPLSFAQERMWVLNRMDPDGSPFRVELVIAIAAGAEELQRAWNALLAGHEVLRTTYRMEEDGRLVQVVHAPQPVRVPVVDLRGVPEGERGRAIAERARPQ